MDNLGILLEQITQPGAYPLFVTGAGISVASGISPFRGDDPDAVWNKDVLEKGTRRFFEQRPVEQWAWYLDRFAKCRGSLPNPAHHAITAIESWLLANDRNCLTVTQNIDGLHVAAGTKNLVECHGSARHIRCSRIGCENGAPNGMMPWDDALMAPFVSMPDPTTVPRCPKCRKYLRPHVLWFDERYTDHKSYGLDRFDAVADHMTTVVFVGTSFSVTVTDLIHTWGYQRGLPMFTIDPHRGQDEMYHIEAKAEDFLPTLAQALPE